MTSKPLSDDEVEICRLLHEKDNDPLEATEAFVGLPVVAHLN